MSTFNYDEWAQEQAEKLRSAVNRYAMQGIYDAAVWLLPSSGAVPGELVVGLPHQPPESMLVVVHFGAYGSRVSAIPGPRLTRAVWEACRRLPVCPVM